MEKRNRTESMDSRGGVVHSLNIGNQVHKDARVAKSNQITMQGLTNSRILPSESKLDKLTKKSILLTERTQFSTPD